MQTYNYSRSLDSVVYGIIRPSEKDYDEFEIETFRWFAGQLGFKPFFVAVGNTGSDLAQTNYYDNWRRVVATEITGRTKTGIYIHRKILRKKGEFPNEVLFSFKELTGVFFDDSYFAFAPNSEYSDEPTSYEKRLIFKPSYRKSDWLRKAREKHCVVTATPSLDLRIAEVYCRNQETKKVLEEIGFNGVSVKRILLPDYLKI